ncbi:MAG: serine hydrolase domain-containing protein [Burkholderiaceae bacterium]
MRLSIRLISVVVLLVILALVAAIAAAYQHGIPDSAAGMAAKNVCSAMFIADRKADEVIEHDILPASAVLRLARISTDIHRRQVSASLPGTQERYAIYRNELGCVTLAPGALPPPDGVDRAPWPADEIQSAETLQRRGGGRADWPTGEASAALRAQIDTAFEAPGANSTSPMTASASGPNTRAVLVIHQGKLLTERYSDGFDEQTPQLGWSMAKTLLSILAWKRFSETDVSMDAAVVDVMTRVPRPNWVGNWQSDDRAKISIKDLWLMRDGLAHEDSKKPWSTVPQMLWSTPDIAAFAGRTNLTKQPGQDFRYSSAVSNLLSRVLREQFSSDRDYWRYPATAIFEPLGMRKAVLETDASGTFIASSYLWARPRDWAKLGWLLLNDGQWQGQQLFPPGWLKAAQAVTKQSDGTRSPYGAHVWQTHDTDQLSCKSNARLPDDGLLLTGHWGQAVGVFPSRQAVIVRMGWTTDQSHWDACSFMNQTLSVLPG